jgi:two-component system cell cycle sensor histidine kinase/response regulator CckA
VRSLIARGLRSRGFVDRGIERVRGAEGVGATGGVVDLVVSDVVMPEMDGPNLLKAIRGRNPEFKFLLISGL